MRLGFLINRLTITTVIAYLHQKQGNLMNIKPRTLSSSVFVSTSCWGKHLPFSL